MNAELSEHCDRLVSAVLNGVGQGLLLVLLALVFLKLFHRANAATRYGVESTVMLLLALLPAVLFYFEPVNLRSEAEVPTDYGLRSPRVRVSAEGEPNPESVSHKLAAQAEETTSDNSAAWTPNLRLPRYASAVVVAIWLSIAGIRLCALLLQVFTLRSLKREGRSAPESVRELFSRLCVELNVSRAPQLRIAPKIPAPMAVGFKEPAVLLPENHNLSGAGLEQVLRHELAHVTRRDDWANLVQQVIHALFFFHPGVIWASRRMTIDREIACDDHVLSAMRDRKSYALALTEFAGRHQARDIIAAPAAWNSRTQLKQRIDMILDGKRNSSPRLSRGKTGVLAALSVIVAGLAFQCAPRLAFAEPAEEGPPAEPAAPVTVAAEAEPPIAPNAPAAPAVAPVRAPKRIAIPVAPQAVLAAKPAAGVYAPSGAAVIASRGQLYVAASPDVQELPDEAEMKEPKVKRRALGQEESLERRLGRLERMVESLARRDTHKKEFEFQFSDKFNPFDQQEVAKLHEKIQKDVEKATREGQKTLKEMQNRGDFDRVAKGAENASRDGLKAHRKALEERRRALEQEMHGIERQIEKLERDQERMERDRSREEARRERDQETRTLDQAKEQDAKKMKEKGEKEKEKNKENP